MDRIMIFDKENPEIGLFSRKGIIGVEQKLVEQFIDYYSNQFKRANKYRHLAIFVEPRIASGFPDIVFADYSPSIMDNWSGEREKLNTFDLKVLSHFILIHQCNGSDIISQLRFPEKQVITSIEKLYDAKLIFRNSGVWKLRDQKYIYSIKKLVSVEAKVSDMKRVAEQSIANTWYASHSYALTSAASLQSATVDRFKRQGIGLYCKTTSFKKVIEARQFSLPSSYLSLQFNEWIGNTLLHA